MSPMEAVKPMAPGHGTNPLGACWRAWSRHGAHEISSIHAGEHTLVYLQMGIGGFRLISLWGEAEKASLTLFSALRSENGFAAAPSGLIGPKEQTEVSFPR